MADVLANRRARKWSRRENALRVIWGLVYPLFRFSPRILWGWRNFLLRSFGATIGSNTRIHPTVLVTIPWNLHIGNCVGIGDKVTLYALGKISIGNSTTISQGAHLCAGSHDYKDPTMPLLKVPISIGRHTWICADAFIGPGAIVGDNAIVGARAVVVKKVPDKEIVAGNPARTIGRR